MKRVQALRRMNDNNDHIIKEDWCGTFSHVLLQYILYKITLIFKYKIQYFFQNDATKYCKI